MIENDRYYRRYVKDVKSGYIFLQTGLVKRGWEKTILVLAFDIENRTMIFESSKIVVRLFSIFK